MDDEFPEVVRPDASVLQTDRNSTSGRRKTDTYRNRLEAAVLPSPRSPSSRTSGSRPEIDETADESSVSREQHHSPTFAVADDSVAQTVATHTDRTLQHGGRIFISGRTGSGIIAELGDVAGARARVEYLDAAAVGVGGEDSTGSCVRR